MADVKKTNKKKKKYKTPTLTVYTEIKKVKGY